MLIVLSFILLTQIIYIPLQTIRYGKITVPIVLNYDPSGEEYGCPVAPGWTLSNSRGTPSEPFGQTVNGDGTHFRYGEKGELLQIEDDAGNKLEFTYSCTDSALLPATIRWPKGLLIFSIEDGKVSGFESWDSDNDELYNVSFRLEPELTEVHIDGAACVEAANINLEYAADGTLKGISRSGGGSVEYSFIHDSVSVHISSLLRRDQNGGIIGISEYSYASDSIYSYVTESVSDGRSVKRMNRATYLDGQMMGREIITPEGRVTRRTWYQYTDVDGVQLPESVTIFDYAPDSLARPDVYMQFVRYSGDNKYHYPVEVEFKHGADAAEKLVYTYPFCPDPNYGSVADSLMARGLAGSVLSVTRWKNGNLTDSSVVVYSDYPAPSAPSGHIYRPYGIVYADMTAKPDTCIKYSAYDSLGMQTSRSTVIVKRSADKIPPELTRRLAPNPMDDLSRELLSYEWCAGYPDLFPDYINGSNYLFDGDGAFLGRVCFGDIKGSIIIDGGYGSAPVQVAFADPQSDPVLIDRRTQVEQVSLSTIKKTLTKASAFDAGNQGFFRGIHYLRRESAFGAKLDFAANSKYAIYPRILYVTAAGPVGTIAQDNHNYGNFLWGAAAREVGIPQWLARLGAHINNFFISVYTRGTFDSPDDQLSIKAGYHWDNR